MSSKYYSNKKKRHLRQMTLLEHTWKNSRFNFLDLYLGKLHLATHACKESGTKNLFLFYFSFLLLFNIHFYKSFIVLKLFMKNIK